MSEAKGRDVSGGQFQTAAGAPYSFSEGRATGRRNEQKEGYSMLDVLCPTTTTTPSKAAATEAATTKPADGQQKRAVRKLVRDLVGFIGTTVNDLAATPRKTQPKRQRQRLLYRHADKLTDADLDRLVVEIGPARLMAALDRWTQPSLFSVAAEEREVVS
jgi:hypothetical protein